MDLKASEHDSMDALCTLPSLTFRLPVLVQAAFPNQVRAWNLLNNENQDQRCHGTKHCKTGWGSSLWMPHSADNTPSEFRIKKTPTK